MKRDRSAEPVNLARLYAEQNYEAARIIARGHANDPRYDGLPRMWAERTLAKGRPPKRGQTEMFPDEEVA